MKLLKSLSKILILLILVACGPTERTTNRFFDTPHNSEPTITDLYLTPLTLVKSTPRKVAKNYFFVDLSKQVKPSRVFVPFYFNSEDYFYIAVMKPTIFAPECLPEEIKMPEWGGRYWLGFDGGHNPSKPKLMSIYDYTEKLGNHHSENTITIIFEAPVDCKKIAITFEAQFTR